MTILCQRARIFTTPCYLFQTAFQVLGDILTWISYNEYAYFIGSTFALDMISKIFLPNLMWEMLKIVFFLLTRVQLQSFPVSWLHGIPCMTACLCHYWSTLSLLFSPPLEGVLWKFTNGLPSLSLLSDWSLGSPNKRWVGQERERGPPSILCTWSAVT